MDGDEGARVVRRQHPLVNTFRVVLYRVSYAVASLEPLLLLVLAPFFLFPKPALTPWLMMVIPSLWLVRWRARGHLTLRTPLDGSLVIIMAMVLVSAWATFDFWLSFPKICGVLFGVALYYALVNAIRMERAMRAAVAALLAGGVGVAVVSLVGTDWPAAKVPVLARALSAVYDRLPALVRGVPRAEHGFNPNQVGGTLTLFIPLTAALLIERARRLRPRLGSILAALGLATTLCLTVTVLVLTQSRLAFAAAALGLLLLGVLGGGWPRALAIGLLALLTGWVAHAGFAEIAHNALGLRIVPTLSGDVSWAGRLEVWRRALRVIGDHPFTGIGFDTLSPIVHARYPTFVLPRGREIAHAHNLYLQVALDLGLPGLLAFLWLLVAWGRMVWQAYGWARSPSDRTLALGLLCGVAAQLLFGLADAIALGQKPGLFLWAALGLGAALWARGRHG